MTAVHGAAREARLQVEGTSRPPTVGRNYYAVELSGLLELRLNVTLRLVAAVYDAGSRLDAEFRKVPGAGVFAAAGFAVAGVAELEGGFEQADLAKLTALERSDIAYHGVWRLGDVVFNWFD